MIKFNKEDIIGIGNEGTVYKIGDKAIKIFREKPKLTEIECKYFKKLSILTEQMLLPTAIYKNKKGEFFGCATKYIEPDSIDDIFKMSKEDLLKNYKTLRVESKILAYNNILTDDLFLRNVVLKNNKIYFVDTTAFRHSNLSKELIIANNIENINTFFIDLIMKCVDKNCDNNESDIYDLLGIGTDDFLVNFFDKMTDKSNIEKEIEKIKNKI